MAHILPEQDPADRQSEFDMERLRLISANRSLGATWAMIGRADGGKPPKIAKRDFKRAARQAGQQWRLQRNRESYGRAQSTSLASSACLTEDYLTVR